MTKLKFTPEWFETLGDDGEYFAERAQELYDAWYESNIEKAPTVWICRGELKTIHFVPPVDATQKAKLVCIEEIK